MKIKMEDIESKDFKYEDPDETELKRILAEEIIIESEEKNPFVLKLMEDLEKQNLYLRY